MLLLSQIAACLAQRNDGQVEFYESPLPWIRQIAALESQERRLTIRKVAEFGLFLEKKKASPEAAAVLLNALEAVSQEILQGPAS